MGLAQADALGLIMDDNGTLWLAGRRTRASQNIRGKNSIEGKVGDEWRKESRELKRKWKVWLYDGQIGWNYRPIACATDVPTSLFEARGGMRSARQKPERTCARVRCRSSDQKKGGTLHFSSSIPRVLFPFFRLSKWQNIILDIAFTQLTATTWTNFGALHAYFSSLTVRRLYDVVAVFSSLYLCSTWFHYTYFAYIRRSWDTCLIHESSASILKVQQINMKPCGSSLQKMNSTDAISRARFCLCA